MTENEIARHAVDAAFRIHTTLGPGLLESVYKTLLGYEMQKRGLSFEAEVNIPLIYGEITIPAAFRADLIIENKVVVEVKSVENFAQVHKKQLLTYLKLTDKRLGLLINFNTVLIKDGIVRIVNSLCA